MGTALTRAQEYLAAIETLGCPDPEACELPTKRYAALGAIVIDCESVIVTATSMIPHIDENAGASGDGFRCAPAQLTTITAVIARECEGGFDDDGFTNTEEYTTASAQAQDDADLLWEAVFTVQDFLGPADISVGWTIEGGIWAASIQYTIGVV